MDDALALPLPLGLGGALSGSAVSAGALRCGEPIGLRAAYRIALDGIAMRPDAAGALARAALASLAQRRPARMYRP
jgi:hypothetical protein